MSVDSVIGEVVDGTGCRDDANNSQVDNLSYAAPKMLLEKECFVKGHVNRPCVKGCSI